MKSLERCLICLLFDVEAKNANLYRRSINESVSNGLEHFLESDYEIAPTDDMGVLKGKP